MTTLAETLRDSDGGLLLVWDEEKKAGFDGGAEPQGGGNSEASRQVQIGMHGPVTNTINLMDKEEGFCCPGGTYRQRPSRLIRASHLCSQLQLDQSTKQRRQICSYFHPCQR